MRIFKKFPVVLTQDLSWPPDVRNLWMKPGRIIHLPEDAVLIDLDDVEVPEAEEKP